MLNIMSSNVCCKEFTGWFKSFTKVEKALVLLEAILLVVLVGLLILLILHLIVCSNLDDKAPAIPHSTTTSDDFVKSITDHTSVNVLPHPATTIESRPVNDSGSFGPTNETYAHLEPAGGDTSNKFTVPGVHCSWTPSAKTTAAVHYYEDGATGEQFTTQSPEQTSEVKQNVTSQHSTVVLPNSVTADAIQSESDASAEVFDYLEELIQGDQSDGEEADEEYKNYVAALVKLKPPKDVIFGCILTIITEYWILTAASCIEAIEEVDSLDSFVIMEQYGTNKRDPLQTIEDVQIHPQYEGKNKSYDLAALKSGGSLIKTQSSTVKLASLLDYALMTIGQRFTILGYGAFRSIDKSSSGRSLRQAAIYRLPARQCVAAGSAEEVAALRHLSPGRTVLGAPCGSAPLCCGALFSRGLPCNYCSGTPLLRGALLFGIMADNRQCGVACEPLIYVNIAAVAEWIKTIVGSDHDVPR